MHTFLIERIGRAVRLLLAVTLLSTAFVTAASATTTNQAEAQIICTSLLDCEFELVVPDPYPPVNCLAPYGWELGSCHAYVYNLHPDEVDQQPCPVGPFLYPLTRTVVTGSSLVDLVCSYDPFHEPSIGPFPWPFVSPVIALN